MNSIGLQILPKIFNISDDPFSLSGISIGPFDDCGRLLKKKKLVENGLVVDFITTKRCDKYYNNANYRMYNLCVGNSSSDTDIKNMISRQENAILVRNIINGSVNPHTGEFVLYCEPCEHISCGKIDGVFGMLILQGMVGDMQNSIVELGNDANAYIGTCSKRGQLITVGSNVPALVINNLKITSGLN
jgi:predicted Zn-dependent protease